MYQLLIYSYYKDFKKFNYYKLQRKNKVVYNKHFVNNIDIKDFNLSKYCNHDLQNRYIIKRYYMHKLTNLINQYFSYLRKNNLKINIDNLDKFYFEIYSNNIKDVKEIRLIKIQKLLK